MDLCPISVKAAIRKKLKKSEGDFVEIIIYPENDVDLIIPGDLLDCLKDEPIAWKKFSGLTSDEKIRRIKWVEAPIGENTRISRISHLIEELVKA